MFPDFDQQLLLSVLDSCGGDHDLAVDMLLEMANPDYKSTANQGGRKSQSELDEELARRLAAEEEFAAAAAWAPSERDQRRRPDAGSRSGSDSSTSTGRRSNRLPEADTFAQVQEQALKFAETGKKAFLSFAATVKKKIQEFDNGPAEDPTYPSTEPGPHTSSYQRPPQPVTQQQQYAPPPSMQGYNIAPAANINQTASVSIPTAPAAAPRSGPGSVSTSPNTGGLSSSPAPPANIDTARLGLLPKRPVSLIDTSTGSGSKKATVADEDDDDLEYVENPFDDKRR